MTVPGHFEQQYACRFWDDDPKSRLLRDYACAYHARTKAFDKTLTWGMRGCLSTPYTTSAQHAHKVRGELVVLCLAEGISPGRLDAAIREAARHLDAPARPDPSPLPVRACGAVGTPPATLSTHP